MATQGCHPLSQVDSLPPSPGSQGSKEHLNPNILKLIVDIVRRFLVHIVHWFNWLLTSNKNNLLTKGPSSNVNTTSSETNKKPPPPNDEETPSKNETKISIPLQLEEELLFSSLSLNASPSSSKEDLNIPFGMLTMDQADILNQPPTDENFIAQFEIISFLEQTITIPESKTAVENRKTNILETMIVIGEAGNDEGITKSELYSIKSICNNLAEENKKIQIRRKIVKNIILMYQEQLKKYPNIGPWKLSEGSREKPLEEDMEESIISPSIQIQRSNQIQRISKTTISIYLSACQAD